MGDSYATLLACTITFAIIVFAAFVISLYRDYRRFEDHRKLYQLQRNVRKRDQW